MGEPERSVVPAKDTGPKRVVITDVDIPFWRLVDVLIRLALASVPAAIALAVIAIGTVLILRDLLHK